MFRQLLTITLIIGFAFVAILEKAQAQDVLTIKKAIVKHSVDLGVDPELGLSIAKQESGFCHTSKSKYGAVGVFQLMPNTAKKLGYNPYYLNENIKGGLVYYKMMYKMFGSVELALAAYNAGPGNVRKYKGIPPFSETKRFISNIMNEYNYQKDNPDETITEYREAKEAAAKAYAEKLEAEQKAAENEKYLNEFMLTQAI